MNIQNVFLGGAWGGSVLCVPRCDTEGCDEALWLSRGDVARVGEGFVVILMCWSPGPALTILQQGSIPCTSAGLAQAEAQGRLKVPLLVPV